MSRSMLARFAGALVLSIAGALLTVVVAGPMSTLSFVGWTAFFLSINAPMFLSARSDELACVEWMRRWRGPR
jgi:hypothetical protein